MPHDDNDYSRRWRLIKTKFTRNCDCTSRYKLSASRTSKKEQNVWQRRFWEHCIKDEKDYIDHIEYIHYNPVKHGLTKSPVLWPHSSFHRFVREGIYEKKWGSEIKIQFKNIVGME